jgi:hypothetical protein
MPNEKIKEMRRNTSVRDKIEEVVKRYESWKESEEDRESRCNI